MAVLLSWNCRGFRSKLDNIKSLVADHHPVCFAIQETYLKTTDSAKIRRYSCLRKDNDIDGRVSGGVALFTSHDYPSTVIPLHTTLQAVAVRVHVRKLITICTLYLSPSASVNQSVLNDLVDQLPEPYIVLGDLNGHSPIWGSPDTNPRGLQIEQLLRDQNLCVLNNGEKTYFHAPNRTFHCIDLALCSPSLLPFWNFYICNDLNNSDHFPILLNQTELNSTQVNRPIRYTYHAANWQEFETHAEITSEMIEGNIDDAVEGITKAIISAADAAIPKTSPVPRKHYKPWWNAECMEAIRMQKKAWNIFRRYPTHNNYIAFKRSKAIARRVRRCTQKESWEKYVSSITSNISCKHLWTRAKKAMGAYYTDHPVTVLETNGRKLTKVDDIANAIASAFATTSSSDSYSTRFQRYKRVQESRPINFETRSNAQYNTDFTEPELIRSLQQSRPSAAGPDNISYLMLQHLSRNSLLNLLKLYNRIWQERAFPNSWRQATIIPFPKPGKDGSQPGNYRPIALTSCMCKLFERMINTRLVYVLETQNCISINDRLIHVLI